MLPIGDDDSGRRLTPIVTYALIAANVLFFLLELSSGEAFIERWAFVPTRFLANPAVILPPFSHPCLCTQAGFICWATCSIYGSLAITSKIV